MSGKRVAALLVGAALAACGGRVLAQGAGSDAELLPPVQVKAGDAPINVDSPGHSAPFYADVDGDGVKDLLVGQFSGGKCRIYKNTGTDAAPKLDKFVYLQAGGGEAKVPYG